MRSSNKRGTKARRTRVRETPPAPYAAHRLLLDTHAWIWWQFQNPRLGRKARAAIESAHDVRLSIVSAWEIAIKSALRKLEVPTDMPMEAQLEKDGFGLLPLELVHIDALRGISGANRDPFDRMIVAQATVEGLTLVTADKRVASLGVPILPANV